MLITILITKCIQIYFSNLDELLSEKLPITFKINKEPLGKGGFCEVCLVIEKNNTAEKEFVAKVINCMDKADKVIYHLLHIFKSFIFKRDIPFMNSNI